MIDHSNMNINRHNYESFFLLYADKELSASERKEVEDFVATNADLAIELKELMALCLPVENIKFPDKSKLCRTDRALEEQENLLLMLDNEVPESERERLQQLISKDVDVSKEWALLQKTLLDADESIPHQDKASLYRYEAEKVRYMNLRRLMVAASIAALLFFGSRFLFRTDKVNDQPQNNGISQNIPSGIPSPVKQDSAINNQTNVDEQRIAQQKIQSEVKPDVTGEKNFLSTDNKQTDKLKSAVAKDLKVPAILNERLLENLNNEESNKSLSTNVSNEKNETLPTRINNTVAAVQLPEKQKTLTAPDMEISLPAPVSYAQQASSTVQDEASDTKVLYMDEDKLNKTRIGGFVRKVKRVIERNTNIKAGKPLRIAGFEIAAN